MAKRKVELEVVVKDREARKRVKGIDGALAALGPAAAKAGLAAAAAMTGIGVASVAAAVQIDNAMKAIQGSTGATGDALTALGEDFRAVLRSVPEDAQAVSTAIRDLNTLTGATGETLRELTIATLDASRALGEDGAGSAAAFGQALNQFNRPAEDGVALLDDLFTVSQTFGVGLGALINQTTEYGSVLQNAGFTMEESAGLFGQLSSAGISVSRVMPGLNAAFRNWTQEGLNSRDMLVLTVDAMRTAATDAEALNIATDAFGAEGAQRMTTAVRSGTLALDDLLVGLNDNEGAVRRGAEATETYAQKWAKLKNQVVLLLEPLGVELLGVFDRMLPTVENLITSTANWGRSMEGLGRVLVGTIGVADAVQIAFNGMQIGISRALEFVSFAAKKLVEDALKSVLLIQQALTVILPGSFAVTQLGIQKLIDAWELANNSQTEFREEAERQAAQMGENSAALERARAAVVNYYVELDTSTASAKASTAANNETANSIRNVVAALNGSPGGGFGTPLAVPSLPGTAGGAGSGGGGTRGGGAGGGFPGGGGGGLGPFQRPGGFTFIQTGPGVSSPFTGFRGLGGGSSTIVNINAQGAVFEDERSLSRLADLIAEIFARSDRLGAVGAS